MKHGNVAVFVPHNGCPHQCSFCNQKNITGQSFLPDENFVKKTLSEGLTYLKDDSKNCEIAFFGGSFTAIDRNYMLSLLDATLDYIDRFKGIRISTRPDYIDEEILSLLKSYKVTSIELGAQSMCDDVLIYNERGHTSLDVIKASKLIKSYGISLGLQIMTGLYKSTPEKDIYTANEFIKLKPDTVRIYPTIVMKQTQLEHLYENKVYNPPTLDDTVSLCAKLISMFRNENIKVIRVGLHYSESLVNTAVAGPYHPAFGELCESRIMRDEILKQIEENNILKGETDITVNPKSLSKLLGQKRANIKYFSDIGYTVNVLLDDTLPTDQFVISQKG